MLMTGLVGVIGIAFGIVLHEHEAETAIVLPSIAETAQAVPAARADLTVAPLANHALITAMKPGVAAATNPWRTIVIKRGQTLSSIFNTQGLAPAVWRQVLALGGATAQLKHLQVGDKMRLKIADGKLQALSYAYDSKHTLHIARNGQQLHTKTLTAKLTHQQKLVSGVIHDSLFVDGLHAGLTSRQIVKLSHIFRPLINFDRDLHPGARFTVIYDQVAKNGKRLHEGHILAAELINQGHTYRLVRFTRGNGESGYYTPKGHTPNPMFLRHPVRYTRISSGFSLHRLNPVLHIVRPHYGTDFAAPMGTPVHVTSNGRVVAAGRESGFGNVIKVRYGRYETVYAHLSRFRKGLHRGTRVKQGEVIGYVGMTGLATGPHLHYEFHVNGKPMNPVTVKLPGSPPLPRRLMAKFDKVEKPLIAQINRSDSVLYADNGPAIGTR